MTPSSGNNSTFDVAIVGAGPTGLVASILLAQRGHSVVVLERQPAPYPLPRAVHFDAEVGRIFQSCGIGDELRTIIEPADVYEWRNAEGVTLLRFGNSGDTPIGWPGGSMFSQPQLEALLERRTGDFDNIVVRRGAEVTAIEQGHDSVEVETATGDSIAARYLIGADGANSTVRRLLGIDMVDMGYFYDWFVVDIIPNEPRVYDPVNLQVCDPARPTTLVSGGPGRRRWEFMRLPDEDPATFNTEAHAWTLLEPWDITPDNAVMERCADYRFHARYAQRWHEGRVFLAGDAAHQTPPFAGQGLCAGVRDSANLAWKLDLVLNGLAAESILEDYDRERIEPAHELIVFAMELGKVICVPDPQEAAKRDAAMAAAVGETPTSTRPLPVPKQGCLATDTALAGHVAVQGTVDGRPFDDVVGAGWRLLTSANQEVDPGAARWFQSIGGSVVAIDPSNSIQAQWFEAHGIAWCLVRPDFLVYGTAGEAGGGTGLIQRLRADLGA